MKDKMAVIIVSGKQHLVTVGSKLNVNRVDTDAGKVLNVTDVLMTIDGEITKIGQPLVDGAKVTLKVLDHYKAKKVTVAKFRAKSRYRRKVGHRQPESTLEVTAIK